MANRLILEGLEEFKRALRTLPNDLRDEAEGIVRDAAGEAGAETINRYPTGPSSPHKHLKDGVVVVRMEGGRFGVGYMVKSTAPHAFIFENGTQARYYFTKNGVKHVTGAMPPGHIFVPIAIRKRRAMYDRLRAMLQTEGFQVSG